MEEEIKVKPYKPKNIKYLSSLGLICILSVVILWYLLSSNHFYPINENGQYIWLNISIFTFLFTSIIGSLVTIVTYLILIYFLKREENMNLGIQAFKLGLYISLGLMVISILNFFHILNIYWGLGILLVIILLSFII